MSDSGHQNRPSEASPATPSPAAAPLKIFRSLRPGESIGPARFNPIREERAAAADQIQRTLKVWRAGNGPVGRASIPEGGGSPLAAGIRSRMEPKLGADLSSVRVHTGGDSAQAASGLGARAFTVGSDVHFNSGEFSPGTREGDKLLAHELTHVVQGQRSGVQRKADEGEVSTPDEPAEQEADAVSEKVSGKLHGAEKQGEGDEAKEQPAQVSAKLEGIGPKVYAASNGAPQKAEADASGSKHAAADPPEPDAAKDDPACWQKYVSNWTGVFLPKLKENGVKDEAIGPLTAQKSQWFNDAYKAMESKDQGAVSAVVDAIFAAIPKDPAAENQLWSGGGTAQGMADQRIAAGGANANGAAKVNRLEKTNIGVLFNGVFDSPPSKLDWKTQAKLFWNEMSSNYADAATGTVVANLNVDLKYCPTKKVARNTIMAEFELPKLCTNAQKKAPDGTPIVKGIKFNAQVQDSGSTPPKPAKPLIIPEIPAAQMTSPEAVLAAIDAAIAATPL
jgi:hypothetical protein